MRHGGKKGVMELKEGIELKKEWRHGGMRHAEVKES